MKNKSTIISTLICLSPMLLAFIFYKKLPEQIAVHFNHAGVADNYLSKPVVVFGLPVLLAIIHLYSNFRINKDPKAENASISLKEILKWLIPVLSITMIPISIFKSMGMNIPIEFISQIILGLILIICGNYMPKCKQNYTVGIKLPWTLSNKDNWNKTHRFSGFIWVLGGTTILLNTFLDISFSITIISIVLLVILPFIYSYNLYKKQNKLQ